MIPVLSPPVPNALLHGHIEEQYRPSGIVQISSN